MHFKYSSFIIGLLLLFNLESFGQASIKPVCPASLQGIVNNTFSVNIVVGDPNPVTNLFQASLTLTITDTSAVQYIGLTNGGFLPGSPLFLGAFNNDRVEIAITSTPSAGSASGSGILIKVNFKVKKNITVATQVFFNILKPIGYTQSRDTIKFIPTETSITLTPATSVEGESQPTSFKLEQNYPNPFNPSTKISYSLPKSTMVDLSVYDINGEKVATLVNEFKEAGNYTIVFSKNNLQGIQGSLLSSGIYVYRIITPEFTQSKKMLIIK